jgi:hypothetical protein
LFAFLEGIERLVSCYRIFILYFNMPFKSTFNALKGQLKDLQNEGQRFLGNSSNSQPSGQPQPQYYRPPPPPPPPPQHAAVFAQGNVGGGPPGQGVYWAARFDPNAPISQEWDEKLGNNNGWGNNELQHYTNERANSFL